MTAWLDGRLVDRPTVSAADPAVQFGLGVFEVVRACDGVPCLLDRHLARMRASARRFGLRIRWSDSTIERGARSLLRALKLKSAYVRLVLTGGSYAGFLTTWIIAHDNRFKAAVAQRGVYDLATFFGEGKAWRLVEQTMGGLPFDARYRQIIDRNSPFNDVSRIRTPLLIKHGSDDLRTGVSQSEMLYRALKALGRPVEYVRYPGAGHDMSRSGEPLQRMDRLNRIIEFFERHIENPRPAPGA